MFPPRPLEFNVWPVFRNFKLSITPTLEWRRRWRRNRAVNNPDSLLEGFQHTSSKQMYTKAYGRFRALSNRWKKPAYGMWGLENGIRSYRPSYRGALRLTVLVSSILSRGREKLTKLRITAPVANNEMILLDIECDHLPSLSLGTLLTQSKVFLFEWIAPKEISRGDNWRRH